MKNKLLLAILFAFMQLLMNAQQEVGWEWATASSGDYDESGVGITTDTKGNTYEMGNSYSPLLTFGTMTSINTNNCYIVKHDVNQQPVWIKRLPKGTLGVFKITSDVADNFYVIIGLGDTLVFGQDTLLNSFPNEYAVLKYTADGNPIWARKINARYITTDAAGNLYATGNTDYHEEPTFWNFKLFVQKYSPDGGLLWTKLSGRTEKGYVSGITANGTTVCVLGSFHKNMQVFSDSTISDTLINPELPREDFIAKFDLTGNELWTKRVGNSNKALSGIAFDKDGEIYFAGHFSTSQIVVGPVTIDNGGSSNELYVIKVNAAGTVLWGGSFGGSSNKTTTGVVVGSDKKVYVAGVIDRNAMVVLFDQTGKKTFSAYTRSGSASSGYGSDLTDVAIDKNNNVFVTGRFTSGMYFSHIYIYADGIDRNRSDAFIGKLGKCFTLYPQEICYTSVDSLSKYNVVKWRPELFTKNIVSVRIFRETTLDTFKVAGTVPVANGIFYDTDSTLYAPFTGDPNKGSYRYKIASVNDCGIVSPLSAASVRTLFIVNNNGVFSIKQGYSSEVRYNLMRDDNNDGNWHVVDSVPSDSVNIAYTDPDYNSFKSTATWRIQSAFKTGCSNREERLYSNIVPLRTIVTSIKEQQTAGTLSVGPNPAFDQILISTTDANLTAVEIFNALGAQVYKSIPIHNNKFVTTVANFENGIYMIKVTTSKGITVKKLVIQK